MKKLLIAILLIGAVSAAKAQFQFNPQFGVTYQQMTNPGVPSLEYRAAMGWQFGADMRIGDRIYFQPGAFFGRNATVVTQQVSDAVAIEDNLVRTNLKLRGLVGYRVLDTYQFDIRLATGPSYDVLLSVDNKNDQIAYDRANFRNGYLNWDAAIGFDMGYFTLEPSASFAFSRVFSDANNLSDLSTRFITYGLTIGINIGNDDK